METPKIDRRMPRLALTALLCAGLLTGGQAYAASADEYLQQAKQYQRDGDLRASIIQLKNLLQADPDHAEARLLLGENYLAQAKYLAAELELRRALAQGGPLARIATPLARVLLAQGKNEALIAAIPADRMPPHAEAWGLRGHALLAQKMLHEATAAYDRALALDSNAAEANLGKAHLAVQAGDLAQSRHLLERVVGQHPKFAQAWSLLGDIERHDKRAEVAETAYTHAIDNRPLHRQDLLNRALVRIFLGRYAAAAEDIKQLQTLEPENAGVNYALAVLAFQRQDYREAEQALQRSLTAAPNNMPAIYYYGLTSYLLNKPETAEIYLTRFLKSNPGEPESSVLLGDIYLSKGDAEAAEKVVKRALLQTQSEPKLLNLMADIMLARGAPAESNSYLRQLTELNPEEVRGYMKLGLGLALAGDARQSHQVLDGIETQSPEQQLRIEILGVINDLQAQELDNAITSAERLLEKAPMNTVLWQLKAVAHLGKGDETGASEAYGQALEAVPGDPSVSHNLARLALRAGAPEKARLLYEAVLKQQPGHGRTLLALAQLETASGDLGKAQEWLELAAKTHPDALEPKLALANFSLRTGQPSRALALLSGLDNTPAVLALVGESRLLMGDNGSARSAFEKLIQAEPGSAQAHYLIAKAEGALGRTKQVQDALSKALELDPQHVLARIALTRHLLLTKQSTEAEKQLAQLSQAYPHNPEVLTLKGWLARSKERPQEAIEAFQEALAAAPSSRFALNLAGAQKQAGRPQDAIETLRNWLAIAAQDVQVLFTLASLYVQQEREAEAIAAFANVVELAPDHLWALNNLAWLLKAKEPTRALAYAQQALERAPEWPAILDTLGMILIEQGRAEEAVRHLSRASKKAPEDRVIRFHLAQGVALDGEPDKALALLKTLLADDQPFAYRQEAESLMRSLGG